MKFSVILPVYNREELVLEAIRSVLSQTYPHFELLVVDSRSTDKTAEVVHQAVKNDQRIKYFSAPEPGRCPARNVGLKEASGDWICFLDSDDIYYPNHLAVLASAIGQMPQTMAFSTQQKVGGKQKKYLYKWMSAGKQFIHLDHVLHSNPIQLNQLCFHQSLLPIAFPIPDLPVSEDLFFVRSLLLKTPVFLLAEITNEVRNHSGRTMNLIGSKDFVRENLRGMNLFVESAGSHLKLRQVKDVYVSTILLCAHVCFSSGFKKDGYHLLHAIILHPKVWFRRGWYSAIFKALFY